MPATLISPTQVNPQITPMVAFLLVFALAFMTESIVEYFLGQPFEKIEKLKKFSWLLIYAAAAAGITGAFIYQLDVIQLLGQVIGWQMQPHPFGIVLTGFAIGRGSSYIHDLFDYLLKILAELITRLRA